MPAKSCINNIMTNKILNIWVLTFSLFGFTEDTNKYFTVSEYSKIELKVHKTPTCGCCKKWINYVQKSGFKTVAEDHQNLDEIKELYRIMPAYKSCHTAVSSNGYVFEGHIPSKYIKQFLEEQVPNAIGLSVPGMPLGSPGMEFGDRKMVYDVLILFKDGSSKVFATVND